MIAEQNACIDNISMSNTERLEQCVPSGQVQLSEEERGPQALSVDAVKGFLEIYKVDV
jgi:hypothetical protein